MSLRARAGRALVLLLLAAAARAQDPIRFDPARDLDGFEACFASEYRDIYPLDAYSQLLGKEMTAAALLDVRNRWAADRKKSEEDLAKLKSDPSEDCLWLLRHRLARSSYFSKITWVEDRSIPGIVLLVQRPAKDAPDYAAGVARDLGPWLSKLQSLFEEQYAKPWMLERPRSRQLWAVAILASEGDYRNFWRIHPNYGPESWAAGYDFKLGVAVGYVDPFRPLPPSVDRRYPILNAFARELIAGYSTAPEGRPGALWIEEGLASYLAYHDSPNPAGLDDRKIRPSTFQSVLATAQDKKVGPILVHPLEDLVALKSTEDIDKSAMRLAAAAAIPPPAEKDVLAAFYGQSTLWMHFLLRGMEGAFRESTLKYLRWAFSGEAGPGALKLAFDGHDLEEIDRDFLTWLAEEGRRELPTASIDAALVGGVFAARSATAQASDASGAASSGPPAGATAAPKVPAFSPAVLAVEAADVESRHGLALLQARAGDLEGAIAALTALSKGKIAGEDAARVEREIARIGELKKLRDGFLESLRQAGTKWSAEVQGKKIVASIAKVEDGSVRLAPNRQGIDKFPLSALDPMEYARQATKKEQQGDAAPWARFYAYVLAEDSKWEKLLKNDSEEARSLRDDAKSWYPARIRAGRAAYAFEELAKTKLPANRGEGEGACTRLRGILGEFRALPLVQRKMGDLKRYARAAVEASLKDVEPASLLHAKWTALDGGRVRLEWDFDSPVEEQDFVRQLGYMKAWRKALKLDVGKEEETPWTVKGGAFAGIGAGCYRLPVSFLAPMTLRYDLSVAKGSDDVSKDHAVFAIGLCDDRRESQILSIGFGGLAVRDLRQNIAIDRPEAPSYVPGTAYRFEVRHDGKNASVWVDGDKTTEAPCPSLGRGEVLLWFHTNVAISVDRFEVEGKIDPASAQPFLEASAARRLTEMGFP